MPGAFLIREDGSLVGLDHEAIAVESDFQALLARYPDLLAGDQVDPEDPRRWLLIAREIGIPDAADGGDRWSLDHLFLDQDAILTFVEVKRAADTRTRREVVAQMLDYAANGITYWPVEQLQAAFASRCDAEGQNADTVLAEFLGDGDLDDFWQQVKTNLQAGRVRLLFVADAIPPELRRVVEFLNRQMDPAEVLAVELRRYSGQGQSMLVPLVYGRSEEADGRKSAKARPTRQWDEQSFFAGLAERSPQDAAAARQVYEWGKARGLTVRWGRGATYPSLQLFLQLPGGWFNPVNVYHGGRRCVAEFPFDYHEVAPFDQEGAVAEFRNRVARVPGVEFSPKKESRRPSIGLLAVTAAGGMGELLAVLDWSLAQVGALPSQG